MYKTSISDQDHAGESTSVWVKQPTFRIGTRNTKDIRYQKNPTVAIVEKTLPWFLQLLT